MKTNCIYVCLCVLYKYVIIYIICNYICVLYKICNYMSHTYIQLCVFVFTDHTDEILYSPNRTLFSCKKVHTTDTGSNTLCSVKVARHKRLF